MNRRKGLKDEEGVLERLGMDAGLSRGEASLYLRLLQEGHISLPRGGEAATLLERGMAIVSGDGKRIIPVHPRLGIANHYRTWREAVIREINERRMRVDRLILELIPLYEAATEKKADAKGA
ncbi:MAG: hypothetical protein JRM91_04175 [Nitrososphaerota archaeon]|nr:hypothetical protein [Nitrososphaerota archaeon]MDG6945843.1 hypothetical protein [Nitrososphaerota archaeon]MDG6949407.1 hypothetical protein [Nitrososphaerota archaeon]